MKKIFILLAMMITGCAYNDTINHYKLEKINGSPVPLCVNYPQRVKIISYASFEMDDCGNEKEIPAIYEPIQGACSTLSPVIVSYDYCLRQLPLPLHLVEKQVKDMRICYDRNNGVELPISYCQKDMNVNISMY